LCRQKIGTICTARLFAFYAVDMTFTHEGNKTYFDGLVNFEKMVSRYIYVPLILVYNLYYQGYTGS